MVKGGQFVTVTYDDKRGSENIDIQTGIFKAPRAGVYEFFYQVSVFSFFFQFIFIKNN